MYMKGYLDVLERKMKMEFLYYTFHIGFWTVDDE